jgi:ethanolamine utilization protein EutQ (cupin superfamily)
MKVNKSSLNGPWTGRPMYFVGNIVDDRHSGPVIIGYGRYAPSQSLPETMAVHDTMIVLKGRTTSYSAPRWLLRHEGGYQLIQAGNALFDSL